MFTRLMFGAFYIELSRRKKTLVLRQISRTERAITLNPIPGVMGWVPNRQAVLGEAVPNIAGERANASRSRASFLVG